MIYGAGGFSQATGSDGILARLDPRLKILCLLCISVYSVMLENTAPLLLLFSFSWVLVAVERIEWRKVRLLLLLVILMVWGTMFSQSVFYFEEPRTVLINLVNADTPLIGRWTGDISIYREGFRYGAVQSLRFASMMVYGLVFCWSTDTGKMLSGMLQLRVPYVIAFMTVTAVRFIPVIMDEFATVSLAMRMRGGRVLSPNPVRLLRNWLKLIRPVFINCYRRSNILSLSIQSRAFSPSAGRTDVKGRVVTPVEAVLLATVMSVTAFTVLLKTFYGLYLWDILYISELRWVYEICRLYL